MLRTLTSHSKSVFAHTLAELSSLFSCCVGKLYETSAEGCTYHQCLLEGELCLFCILLPWKPCPTRICRPANMVSMVMVNNTLHVLMDKVYKFAERDV